MKRGFDNFNAVDSGFASFITTPSDLPNTALDQQTINTNNLLSRLPQGYADALQYPNLLNYLNETQSEALRNAIIAIANDSSTSMAYKIMKAQGTIERALPNNPNIAGFIVPPADFPSPVVDNMVTGNSSNDTRSTNNTSPSSPDSIKNVFIVLAIGIIGFIGYTALKK
jgi:hypothetical protein